MNFAACDVLDDQLHQAVVQEEPVAGLDDSRQTLEADRYALRSAGDLLRSQYELLTGLQLYRLWFNLADTHLGARQVGHDRHPPADGLRRRADALDALRMFTEVSVREVKPGDIQPCVDETFQHLRWFRCWSDRGDDFSLVAGKSHQSSPLKGARINSDRNGLPGVSLRHLGKWDRPVVAGVACLAEFRHP